MLFSFGSLQHAAAQNLVISNARLLDGNGGIVDDGTIVVRRGRISAFSEDDSTDSDFLRLDAQGRTVIPAFTDAHRQLIQGDPDTWMAMADERMRAYLEAGITTVVTADASLEHVLALRDRLETREIEGPRLLVSGPVPLTRDTGEPVAEDHIRTTVRNLTLTGVDGVTSVVRATPGGHEREAMAIMRDEANEQGLLAMAHIRTVADAVAAVEGGSGYLTSTPRVGELDAAAARGLVEAGRTNAEYGLVMTSTLAALTLADPGSPGLANARLLWDAGIIYGYGSDTDFAPGEALRREVDVLARQFSNGEILSILTKNAALAARRDDALGTLERGKFADLLILDGDPLTDVEDVFEIAVVIKTGRVVVDNR